MNLLSKLVSIRKSVEYIQKTERGNQGAMYADPAVLIHKIRKGMDEHNILLVPALENSTIEVIPDPTKNNPNATSFLFKSAMKYTFMDADSDEMIIIPWFIAGKHLQDPAMAGGVALTYYERYFLLKFFQIPTSKDDPEYFEAKTATALNSAQAQEIMDLLEASQADKDAFFKFAGATDINGIHPSKFNQLKSMLLAKKAKAGVS